MENKSHGLVRLARVRMHAHAACVLVCVRLRVKASG